ncbi:MAG: hypothetical protein ACX932_04565 [Gammaproteobacteria bacterium]
MSRAKSYEETLQAMLEKNPALQIDAQKIYQEALQGNSPGRDATPQGDPIGQSAQTGQIRDGMRPGTSLLDDNRLAEQKKQHPGLDGELADKKAEKAPDEKMPSTAPNPFTIETPQLKRK